MSLSMSEPTKFGKYEIRRELGRGAMGIIYEGLDPFIQRAVAIKTIQKFLIDESQAQEIFNRFRREAQAAGRLTHPNIVSIYEYGEDNDVAFIAMELVVGKELKEYFDTHDRFEISKCEGIMQQLLDALEYSHSRGVVHRDIKPSNILITQDGQVKVADFGIAKIESSDITQAGAVLGTPTYMSPEQFIGLAVDHRSDIYSAGVILYQFLTGERPFTGSMTTIMHKVLHQAPVPPSALNANVSIALNDVVSKAMAKLPEARFQTAAEFLQALKQAIQAPHASAGKPPGLGAATKPLAMPPSSAEATNLLSATEESGAKPLHDDLEYWKRIKISANPVDFKKFIREYPDSEFTGLARQQIIRLEEAMIFARAEEKRKWEIGLKRKQAAEEQANRAQRFAALKAAADAKFKEESAEQACRAQKMAAIAAQKEAGSRFKLDAERSRQQSASSSQALNQHYADGINSAKMMGDETKPAPKGFFNTLRKLFS